MTWISLDCRLPDHPKMALLPNDAARYGWIVVLLRAKEQRTPGTFASESHFREVLGRHAKNLPFYKEAGLLEDNEDRSLVVHGWKQYQWAVRKQRQRGDIDVTSEGHERDETVTDRYKDSDSDKEISNGAKTTVPGARSTGLRPIGSVLEGMRKP